MPRSIHTGTGGPTITSAPSYAWLARRHAALAASFHDQWSLARDLPDDRLESLRNSPHDEVLDACGTIESINAVVYAALAFEAYLHDVLVRRRPSSVANALNNLSPMKRLEVAYAEVADKNLDPGIHHLKPIKRLKSDRDNLLHPRSHLLVFTPDGSTSQLPGYGEDSVRYRLEMLDASNNAVAALDGIITLMREHDKRVSGLLNPSNAAVPTLRDLLGRQQMLRRAGLPEVNPE